MNGFVRLLAIGLATCFFITLAQGQGDGLEQELQDDFANIDSASPAPSVDEAINLDTPAADVPAPEPSAPADPGVGSDEFSEFADQPAQPAEQAPPPEQAPQNELVQEPEATPSPSESPPDLDSEFNQQQATEPPPPDTEPSVDPQPAPVEPVPIVEQPAPPTSPSGDFKYAIKNIRYRPHANGGSIIIEGTAPLSYGFRKNQSNSQFTIDIPETRLPDKLKRPLVTKDIGGPYGSIDAYQKSGSTVARIVVQLRQGAMDPIVQTEGNSILIIGAVAKAPIATGADVALSEGQTAEPGAQDPDQPNQPGTDELALEAQPEDQAVAETTAGVEAPSRGRRPLDARSLDEFLSANKRFYGEKQNFEVVDMDMREFMYKYMAEWSGLNIFVDDNVKSTITIKLTETPWDQALVDILKWKKLSYVKVGGNGIRIANQGDIAKEIEDLSKAAENKRNSAPLVTKKFYLSFVKADEEGTRITKYLSKRGILNTNAQAQHVVVTDNEEVLAKVEAQIKHDDVAPRQVLIEGKIVEVSEKVSRAFGIDWNFSGNSFDVGDKQGSLGFGINPGASAGTFNANFSLGTFDVLGSLSATLSLFESEGMAKVVSSPRVVTMNQMQAKINQTTKIPYSSGTAIPAAGAAAGTAGTQLTPGTGFEQVPLTLNVTPQITHNGSIMMKINFERSFVIQAGGGSDAPTTESRTVETNVLVRNGQTAVIGGVYQSDSTSGSNKVPFVSEIPLIGWLFKNSKGSNVKNELMIFMTPKILGELDDGASESMIESKQGAKL